MTVSQVIDAYFHQFSPSIPFGDICKQQNMWHTGGTHLI